MGQPASKLGPLSACQQNVIRMAFQWRADNGPIVRAQFWSFGWRFSGGPIMARLYVLTGCWSVLNPTCIYSSILAMFFSSVRFVSVNMYRLFNVLCWLWNIYEGAELPSVHFITNTKHCITYLALTQLFPVLVSHPRMYTLCSILLHFV